MQFSSVNAIALSPHTCIKTVFEKNHCMTQISAINVGQSHIMSPHRGFFSVAAAETLLVLTTSKSNVGESLVSMTNIVRLWC